jgi:hypothetical protein
MQSILALALACLLLVSAEEITPGDFKLLINNVGENDGLSLYFVGSKAAPGAAMPETTNEYFTDFVKFGTEVAHFAVSLLYLYALCS